LLARSNDGHTWSVPPQEVSPEGLKKAVCALADTILVQTNRDLLAAALIRRGDFQRVEDLYGPLPSIEQNPNALNNLGVALRALGKTDDAISRFRKALDRTRTFGFFGSGNLPEAHYNLGSTLDASGRYDEAISEFRRALALRPDYAEAHNDFGVALVHKG